MTYIVGSLLIIDILSYFLSVLSELGAKTWYFDVSCLLAQ
jgi:hypothetical protein